MRSNLGRVFLVFVAFISLGLPDGLLGVAWPSIRNEYSRPLDSLGLLLLAFTAGYLTSSSLAGYLMSRAGVGGLLAASCVLTGASLLAYTLAGFWLALVVLAVATGLGAGAIDGGINTYVAAHHGERLMHWLHASWGIGITLGPLLMTTGLVRFDSWRWGYHVVGLGQVLLGFLFVITARAWRRPAPSHTPDHEKRLTDFRTPLAESLRQPRVWLSVFLFLVFSGIEATAGVWAYSLLSESRGMPPRLAGLLAGAYWATFTAGRIVAGLGASRIGGTALVRICMAGMCFGTLLLAWNPTLGTGIAGLLALGFFLAPVFPGLVSDTANRVGRRDAANTIGIQIGAAGLGAAVLPGLAGSMARHYSMEVIPLYVLGLTALFCAVHQVASRR